MSRFFQEIDFLVLCFSKLFIFRSEPFSKSVIFEVIDPWGTNFLSDFFLKGSFRRDSFIEVINFEVTDFFAFISHAVGMVKKTRFYEVINFEVTHFLKWPIFSKWLIFRSNPFFRTNPFLSNYFFQSGQFWKYSIVEVTHFFELINF